MVAVKTGRKCAVPDCAQWGFSTWPGWARIALHSNDEIKRGALCPEHVSRLAQMLGWALKPSNPQEESLTPEEAARRDSSADTLLDRILWHR
jgi:hypothetical protein